MVWHHASPRASFAGSCHPRFLLLLTRCGLILRAGEDSFENRCKISRPAVKYGESSRGRRLSRVREGGRKGTSVLRAGAPPERTDQNPKRQRGATPMRSPVARRGSAGGAVWRSQAVVWRWPSPRVAPAWHPIPIAPAGAGVSMSYDVRSIFCLAARRRCVLPSSSVSSTTTSTSMPGPHLGPSRAVLSRRPG